MYAASRISYKKLPRPASCSRPLPGCCSSSPISQGTPSPCAFPALEDRKGKAPGLLHGYLQHPHPHETTDTQGPARGEGSRKCPAILFSPEMGLEMG